MKRQDLALFLDGHELLVGASGREPRQQLLPERCTPVVGDDRGQVTPVIVLILVEHAGQQRPFDGTAGKHD